MIRQFRRSLALLTAIAVIFTAIPADVFARADHATLAPWSRLLSRDAQRLMYFALRVPHLMYAESPDAKELLDRYSADALCLRNGNYLVDKSIFNNDEDLLSLFSSRNIDGILKAAEKDPRVTAALTMLIRVILHENIEKLMRVIAATDSDRYYAMKEFVFARPELLKAYEKYLATTRSKSLPEANLLFNDIVASGFELIILEEARMLDHSNLSPEEGEFLEIANKIFSQNRINYFTAEFWDERELYKAINRSLHIGYAGSIAAHSAPGNKETLLSAPPKKGSASLEDKIANLTRGIGFNLPREFEDQFYLYYKLRFALIADADQNKADDFNLHYRQMLVLLDRMGKSICKIKDRELLTLASQLASSGVIPEYMLGPAYAMKDEKEAAAALRKEIKGLTTADFNSKTRRSIDRIVDDIVNELYDDSGKREAMKRELKCDIKTYHFANLLPIDTLEEDFSVHRERYRDALIALPAVLSAYACKVEGENLILTHEFIDYRSVRASLTHEMFHYFMDRGEIKAPARAESITFTAQFLDIIRNAPKDKEDDALQFIEDQTKLPLFRELFNRGKELGLNGEVGFKILPGVSGNQAEYFSLKGLLLEAQIIFRKNGRDAAELDHSYSAQMAIAAILTGQLLGLHEKDGIAPLRLLKDFFNDLAERCAPPDKKFLGWINNEGGLLSELKRYASYLFAKRIVLKKKTEGLWSYEDKGELSGVLYYVESDLYPRPTDGIDESDFEGRKEAVRERVLAQLILAVSRVIYGKHNVAEKAVSGWRDRPEIRLLWDGVLTGNTIYSALGRNQVRNRDRADSERYRGAGAWITRLFKDRYNIGNPVIEKALLAGLPLHLQYIDSILYRWVFYDKKTGKLSDPRLVSEKVASALIDTQGTPEEPGWEELMFKPGTYNGDTIISVICDKILPAYNNLYEEAAKEAERKAAYERMLKEEKAERARKDFDEFTEDQLDAIDKYMGGLSEEDRNEIKEQVREELDKALEEYANQMQGDMPFMEDMPEGEGSAENEGKEGESAGRDGDKGKSGKMRGDDGKPGDSSAELAGLLDNLGKRIENIKERMDELSKRLKETESKADEAGDLSHDVQDGTKGERGEKACQVDGLAGNIQKEVNASLQKGRDIQKSAEDVDKGVDDINDGMPNGKETRDAESAAGDVSQNSVELVERLERLQNEANCLKDLAERLSKTVSKDEVDESHVRAQTDAISEAVKGMKDDVSGIDKKSGKLSEAVKRLEGELKRIEKINKGKKGKEKSREEGVGGQKKEMGDMGKERGGEGQLGRSQSSCEGTSADITPTTDSPEGLEDIARKTGSNLTDQVTPKSEKPRPAIFDAKFLNGLRQQENERNRLREPLNDAEQREYDNWMDVSKATIDRMTQDLRLRLNILAVGLELESGLKSGPKLHKVVQGVMGQPPFARRHEREPRRVKISLLIDRSSSMRGDSIKYAKLTAFILLNTMFNLNEELERLGFDPIEFEVGLFTTEDAMSKELQISLDTIAEKPHICRERLIYNIMKKIEAGGGTDDVSALGRYVTRMIESPDRGSERTHRIFFSIGDANLGTDANANKIQAIIKKAKDNGIHIFGVSVGDDSARKHMKSIYGKENTILPKALADLPSDLMNKFCECIPMPRPRPGAWAYLPAFIPWSLPLAISFKMAVCASQRFLLSAPIDRAKNMRDIKKIEGYRHFYIEKAADKEYLVFKKDGVPELKWERGQGGTYVPQKQIPDLDTNEEFLITMLNNAESFGQDHLIELVGETGVGKGELLRAAACLLNMEYHFVACNEDMEVEELSETRSLGNVRAGVSGYEPSIIAQVLHNGGWVVLDERNKIPQKVLNQLKSHLSGRNHIWNETDNAGNMIKKTSPNHPRARIFSTMNPTRAGIHSVSGFLDSAMQRRVKRIYFTWLRPEEEVEMQEYYAKKFAEECGIEYSDGLRDNIESLIECMVKVATKERLTFAGYSANQMSKILDDWRLLNDKNFAPTNKIGEYLKRPPSPRTIKNIVRHIILYPKDLEFRKWSTVLRYFNYTAENDKLGTFANVINDFHAEGFVDDNNVSPIKINESSFYVDGDYLVVTPLCENDKPSAWDPVRVALHRQASIRTGKIPESVIYWLQSSQNAIKFYKALQSLELGRDLIFVGEQETGKSGMAEAIAELLSGPEIEIQPVTFSTSKEDITFTPHIGEDGAKAYQSGYKPQRLPRTMDDGTGHGKILIMEETNQGRPGVIGLLNEVAERGELPHPFSKKLIKKQPGSAIIHTINPPKKDFDVNPFSDEFLERHTIIEFTPLLPEDARGFISDASKIDGLQVHPRLIGEVERDALDNIVMVNGYPKYKGILGVEQYLRSLRAKDPSAFPRAPGVGTNKDFARELRNQYEFEKVYYGLSSQEAVMAIFMGMFTLDGPDEKTRAYNKVIKDAFIYAGLWTDAAEKDAVDEFLRGEDILIERLPVLREPDTGIKNLDRKLMYIQENTRGVAFKKMLAAIQKRCSELYDENAWGALAFRERAERAYILKEIYQVICVVLKKRRSEMYDLADWKTFENIKEGIAANLVVRKDWPDFALTGEYGKDDMLKKLDGIAARGELELDDIIGKLALFFDDKDYSVKTSEKLAELIEGKIKIRVLYPITADMIRNLAILDSVNKSLSAIAGKSLQKTTIEQAIQSITSIVAKYLHDSGIGDEIPEAALTKLTEWLASLSPCKSAEAFEALKDILKQVPERPVLEALYTNVLNISVISMGMDDAPAMADILNYIHCLIHTLPVSGSISARLSALDAKIAALREEIKTVEDKAKIEAARGAGRETNIPEDVFAKIRTALPDTDTLETSLNTGDGSTYWKTRHVAAIKLGCINTEDSLNILIERLFIETDADVLYAICDSINHLRSLGITPNVALPDTDTLENSLDTGDGDTNWKTSYAAAINLGCINNPDSLDILIERFSIETDADVLRAIRDSINHLRSLGITPNNAALPDISTLKNSLNTGDGDTNWKTRYVAAINLGCINNPDSLDILIERLSIETHTDVLYTIRDSINHLRSLGITPNNAALPDISTLENSLNTGDGSANWKTRHVAAINLGCINTQDSLDILIERFSIETHADVLCAICDSINYLRSFGITPSAALPDTDTLENSLNNENGSINWKTRHAAAINLGFINNQDSLDILIKRLSSETNISVLRTIRDSIKSICAKLYGEAKMEDEPDGREAQKKQPKVEKNIADLKSRLVGLNIERGRLEQEGEGIKDKDKVRRKTPDTSNRKPVRRILSAMPHQEAVSNPATEGVIAEVVQQRATDVLLQKDVASAIDLYCVRMEAALKEGRRYEIRYNERLLGKHYVELLKEYIDILNARFSTSEFKLIGSALDGDLMFETKCYKKVGGEIVGEGRVNVRPEEGVLGEYLVRVVAIMNISVAIAGADAGDYAKLSEYVASQYRMLTATDLMLTGNPNEDIEKLRNLPIILPKAARLNPEEQALKNAMAQELLRKA